METRRGLPWLSAVRMVRRHRLASMLVLVWLALCCRGREGLRPADAASPAPGAAPKAAPEAAALLLVDADGALKTVCLSADVGRRDVMPGARLGRILDAVANGEKLTVAALSAPEAADGRLLLLSPGAEPRVVVPEGVRYARFSPAGDALLIETVRREHVGGGAIGQIAKSQVLVLATGKLQVIGDYADPRWDADGQRVLATAMQRKPGRRGARSSAQWLATRVAWDRRSGAVTSIGPGSSQIPSPRGAATAWLEEEWRSPLSERCSLSLGGGTVSQHPSQHPMAGRFCQGYADDRGARWSPDGRYLAFTGFASSSSDPVGTLFVDVVSVAGERHPGVVPAPGSGRPLATRSIAGFPWLDWSPSEGRLAVQDADQNLQVLDLSSRKLDVIGKGQKPEWSPRGGYLLIRAPAKREHDESPTEAFVVPGGSNAARVALGPVKDVRWAPSETSVCRGGT